MSITHLTNADFLAALREPGEFSGLLPSNAKQWVCHYPEYKQAWRGYAYTHGSHIDYPNENTFFSVSVYQTIDGVIQRKNDNFAALLCVVLDDVGTKAKIPELEPTWKLETSPGNEQWGYLLEIPITDREKAKQLMKAIIEAGYSDPGANSPETRYMRLPVGSNGKPEHTAKNNGVSVPHRIIDWNPKRRFLLEHLVQGLNLNLEDRAPKATHNSSSFKPEEYLGDDALIRQIVEGESYHDNILVLAARYSHRGMKKTDIVTSIQGLMMSAEDRSERWKDRYKDIPRIVESGIKKFQNYEPDAAVSFIDFSTLLHTYPPPRRWIVEEWLPQASVTLLSGAGGIGKSLISEQLAFAVASGTPWLGIPCISGNVMGFFCEDDSDEMLRRAQTILAEQFSSMDAAFDRLYLDARAGKSNTLVTFGSDRQATLTPFMLDVQKQCEEKKPALIIFDNIAQLFGGLENDRYQVTYFCNLLTGLARQFDCAVLLLGHPAKAVDSEFSGSTAWEAAVRTRIFLQRHEDRVFLHKAKANYSGLESIQLVYQNGYFVAFDPLHEPEILDKPKALILQCLDLFTAREESCSHNRQARNYLVKKIMEEELNQKFSKKLLGEALSSLIAEDGVSPNQNLPWKNSSRHAVKGLIAAPLA